MVYDLLDSFKEEYYTKGDKLILDNYELKEGLYVKVSDNGNIGSFIAQKKDNKIYFSDLNDNINYSTYEWFKVRDYYSGYLNSNKSFFDKKIHNINYLSLFIKLESFISDDIKKRLDEDSIKSQYKNLCSYEKFTKPKEKEILKTFKDMLLDKTRKKDIIKKYKWIQGNIDKIVNIAKENNVKNYIKIFFDVDISEYEQESEIYYAIKIFNDINFSKNIDGEVFGLSDSNMGLNAKKTYLEQKTRKEPAPFLIEKENALLLKKFFDWLKFQKFQDKKPLGREFFINRDFQKKDLIIDFEYLPTAIDKFEEPIMIKNYLFLKKDKKLIEDESIEHLYLLENKIDEILFNRQLKSNYYGEVYKKLDNSFASLIYTTRNAMIGYFKKCDDRAFYQVIQKYTTSLVIEHIKKGRFLLAGISLNIKFSLRNKGENTLNIKQMQESMIDRIEDSNYDEISSEEFFYICGQVAKYLISQSESHQKNGDMLEAYLRANKSNKLKKVIQNDYFKYKHSISLHYVKFNNAMSLINAYDETLSIDMDSFLVGALSDNIFYMKKDKEE